MKKCLVALFAASLMLNLMFLFLWQTVGFGHSTESAGPNVHLDSESSGGRSHFFHQVVMAPTADQASTRLELGWSFSEEQEEYYYKLNVYHGRDHQSLNFIGREEGVTGSDVLHEFTFDDSLWSAIQETSDYFVYYFEVYETDRKWNKIYAGIDYLMLNELQMEPN